MHGLSIGVFLHVKGLNLTGIVGHYDWTFEVFFHKIAFMFAAEVHSPACNGELKPVTLLDSRFENVDAFGVSEAHEALFDNGFQGFDERLVNHLVEESKVVFAVVEGPLHAIFDEILLQVHEFFLV